MALAAVTDGLMHEEVVRMAALGSWGEYPGNCNRDLKKLINCSLPEPFMLRVPCLDTKPTPHRVCFDDASVMLPHLWIASMAEQELLTYVLFGPGEGPKSLFVYLFLLLNLCAGKLVLVCWSHTRLNARICWG